MTRQATLRHKLEAASSAAWLFYPRDNPAVAIWIPKSVCTHRSQLESPREVKHPLTQITVEAWWLEKNPHLDRYFT